MSVGWFYMESSGGGPDQSGGCLALAMQAYKSHYTSAHTVYYNHCCCVHNARAFAPHHMAPALLTRGFDSTFTGIPSFKPGRLLIM